MSDHRRKRWEASAYVEKILQGDSLVLSQAITVAESTLEADEKLSNQILEQLQPYTGKSIRVGITGVPGVGKSTFIESIGKHLTDKEHKVAVLAVDPTSQRTKGSILGDKTRMQLLANDPNAFVRPSPSHGVLGGIASKTREIILLCEAAGFDIIIVETVGVGQSEIAVHNMVDFFLLLMLAGAGDELQGMKKGIMEMADAIAINKADGDNLKASRRARAAYQNALHLFPITQSGWQPKVLTCSALTGESIDQVWQVIKDHEALTKENKYFEKNRQRQDIDWMDALVREKLERKFYGHPAVVETRASSINLVKSGKMPAKVAAEKMIDAFEKTR